jgi:hypothetical protein
MGIFDDAIREHLELKRHAGVDEEELKELEDEAFGPPARPGDPDFPGSTSEEAAVESSEGSDAPAVFDAETDEAETPDDAVIEAEAAEEPALTPLEQATVPTADDAPTELQSEVRAAPEETSLPEAPAKEVEPDPEPEPEPDPAEASSFTTAEREAIADQPTVFFEQQAPEEFELGELDLDIDEEIEEVGGAVSEPLTEEEPLIVEEAFSESAAETEVVEPPHEAEPEPAPEPAAEDAETAEPGTSDEDVLEETPEFLRDNPDDDELWFEQGEPKDFDF